MLTITELKLKMWCQTEISISDNNKLLFHLSTPTITKFNMTDEIKGNSAFFSITHFFGSSLYQNYMEIW